MNPLWAPCGVTLTVAACAASRARSGRYPSPFTTPVFFSTGLIVPILPVSGTRFSVYEPARDLLVKLLGPATVALAEIIQGNLTLAAGFVVATGMIGTMASTWLMTRACIHHPLARGLALGTISHGQGTAQALSEGEQQGAVAGISMGVAAVVTSAALPSLLQLLQSGGTPARRVRSRAAGAGRAGAAAAVGTGASTATMQAPEGDDES